MSYSSYEKAVRALVEGGLRMINNMIPDVPASATRRSAVQISPAQGGGTQLRLPLTQPGRGAQTYSPTKSSTPQAAAEIQSARRALPAESSAQRNEALLRQAQESGLVVRPTGGVRAGYGSPEFSQYVFDRARTPRTTRMTPTAITPSQPQAPVPDWALSEQLNIADPEVYKAVRSIAESTARERGVRAEDVMEALLSPPGSPRAGLLEQLAQPSELVPSPRGKATEGRIEPVDVYEVIGSQMRLPEGQAARAFAGRGGVNMIDIGQALQNPEFAQAVASSSAARAQEVAQAAGGRIPVGPFVGGGILGGLGLGAYLANQQPEAPGTTQLGTPTATVEAGANLPAVTGEPLTPPVAPLPGATNAIPGTVNPSSLTPATAPALRPGPPIAPGSAAPVISTAGAGSVVQQANDGDSNYRQAVQNASQALRQDASQYGPGQAGAFYAAQQAYAKAPGRDVEIIGALRGLGAPASVGIESDAAFESWAKANPVVAYQLQLRMQRRGPSQQMPVAQGAQVGTTLGTNFQNNAVGQSRAAAENAVMGTQGAADMADALRPQSYATLQAPRSAMYAGY